MEPPDDCFEHHHDVICDAEDDDHQEEPVQHDDDNEIEAPPHQRQQEALQEEHDDATHPPPSSLVHSVLLADGIHHHVTEELISDIPDRFEKGSTKAKATWFGALCVAGIGMFVEAFVIITTGQVKTVWKDEYPECWAPDEEQACPNKIVCCGLFPNTPTFDNGTCAVEPLDGYCEADTGAYPDDVLCSQAVTGSISYSEFAGIMAGMIVFGAICDAVGRKNAGMLTSLIMITSIGGMTYFDHQTPQTLFAVFSMFFGLFGFGVGGEYPLTASGAAEHHAVAAVDAEMDNEARHRHRVLLETAKTARRGETIIMVFAMQGVGTVFGSAILQSLILFSKQTRVNCNESSPTNSSGNDPNGLSAVWRSFYMFGLVFIVMLLLYRYLVLEEGDGHAKVQERKKRREKKLGGNKRSGAGTLKLLRFYSLRLIGTGGCWFLADIVFYGLKLFSGPIFADINPNGDLISTNGWLFLSNIISMFGYYGASMLVDNKRIGRRNLQLCSFIVIVVLFFISAAVFETAPSGVIMFLFFLSGFFINFGPNSTSYLMAAETYPTELRGTMHGASAFMGKTGALVSTIAFDGMSTTNIFWMCGIVGICGAVLTFLFSVDMTHVSLAEHDAQLELFLEGRLDEYKGKLNAPEHLSNFEKWTGRHGAYDPQWAAKLVEEEKSKQQHVRTALDSCSSSLGGGMMLTADGSTVIVGEEGKVE